MLMPTAGAIIKPVPVLYTPFKLPQIITIKVPSKETPIGIPAFESISGFNVKI